MTPQAPGPLQGCQMLLHRSRTELQPFGKAAGREGGFGCEIPQDPLVDGQPPLRSDDPAKLRSYLRADLRTHLRTQGIVDG